MVTNNSINSATTTGTVVAGNGNGYTNVPYSSTPSGSAIAQWNANSNLSANSVIEGYTTTATAAGTTTLTVSSSQQQYFTGTTTQTVVLPVTSTLVLGQSFTIVNNSTGIVTVQSSGANIIQPMAANTSLIITVILTSGTTPASWSFEYSSNIYGITTVGDVTSGHVAFNGTAGTTLTSTSSGLTLNVAQASGLVGGNVNINSGTSSSGSYEGGSVNIISGTGGSTSGLGGSVTLVAGSGGPTSYGGPISLFAGSSGTSGTGGNITLIAGSGGVTGTGGTFQISAGTGGGTSGNGGQLLINSGTTTSGVGGAITVTTGSSTGTNQSAGQILIKGGQSTGTGTIGKIIFECDATNGVSGTSVNALAQRLYINGKQNLTSATPSTIAIASFTANNQMASGQIIYSVEVFNGTDVQCSIGTVSYAFTNKGGTISGTIALLGAEVQNLTFGTLTNIWTTDTSGNVIVTSTSTLLTPTSYRMTFTAFSNSQQQTNYN